MPTLTTILTRTSYRGKYDPTPIPREHLQQLLEAGFAAPSGCNKQTTSLIAVDDPNDASQDSKADRAAINYWWDNGAANRVPTSSTGARMLRRDRCSIPRRRGTGTCSGCACAG